jgi:hypothetical protein
MVNREELIGTTENMTLYTRCRLHRCRYNRVPLYITDDNVNQFATLQKMQAYCYARSILCPHTSSREERARFVVFQPP